MTKDQIKLIHIAQSQLKMSDEQYRMLLWNVAGVRSCKDLTNEWFEDCMAVMEDMGFVTKLPDESALSTSPNPNYWRNKVERRKSSCNERMVRKIHELHRQCPRYPLDGLTFRMSNHRTNEVEKLSPHEAYSMIEALKKIAERPKDNALPTAPFNPIG